MTWIYRLLYDIDLSIIYVFSLSGPGRRYLGRTFSSKEYLTGHSGYSLTSLDLLEILSSPFVG